MLRTSVIAVLGVVLFNGVVSAKTLEKSGTFSGVRVEYRVVVPDNYDPSRTYPVVLAFAGGSQEMRIVDNALKDHWIPEAQSRGYIVISPAAPAGRLFFENGDVIFPAFLDQILRDYKVESGKLHIAGRSNGGLSAFHIASSYPKYFRSLIGFPGLLPEATTAAVEAIKPLCIYMHVGEHDSGWREAMQRQFQTFRQKGFRVQFTVEPGQDHSLETLAGAGSKRLFDELADSARTCK